MATIIEREAVVGPDGKIEIAAPELAPGQRVKVTVEIEGQAPHGLDWETASPEEIIAELRASRVESTRDVPL